jgi:hypothetical protein
MTTSSESLTIAQTILDQMGGIRRIATMIGATFASCENGVRIYWKSRQPSKGNICQVVLTPADTYTVTFYNRRAGTTKVIRVVEDVYFDGLVDLFERQTGYYLHF